MTLPINCECGQTLIALAMRGVPDRLLWRFGADSTEWKRDMKMVVADLRNGGQDIDYRRPDDKKALMVFTNCLPMEGLHNKKIVDIPTGPPVIIDKVSIVSTNFDGVVEVPVDYDSQISRLVTRDEAFAFGFTQSVKSTYGIEAGGDVYGGKVTASLELGLEARQDHTTTDGLQEGVDRGRRPFSCVSTGIRHHVSARAHVPENQNPGDRAG